MSNRVSIIVPALNEAPGIGVAIDRAQNAGAWEVIVVDGGSDDATVEIARSRGCRVLEGPRGRAAQQNLGARHARGDVLLFLHADNWLEPGALEQVEGAMSRPGVVAGAFRQRIEATGRLFRLLEHGNAFRVRVGQLPYGDQGIFLRRETFEAVGGFPQVRLMEDVLLSRKLRRRGRIVLLPGPLFVSARRWQQYGVIRQTARNWLLLSGAALGVSPDRLADFYPMHRPRE